MDGLELTEPLTGPEHVAVRMALLERLLAVKRLRDGEVVDLRPVVPMDPEVAAEDAALIASAMGKFHALEC